MIGMDAATGRALTDAEHIQKSVRDILTTPLGSRVMRRDYGSLVPELIDHPANGANLLRLMSATVVAIARWEPRLRITRVMFDLALSGTVVVSMDAVLASGARAGQPISMALKV